MNQPIDVLAFRHKGKDFRYRAISVNVAATTDRFPARASNAFWECEVDGIRRQAVSLNPDDTAEEAIRRIIEWFDNLKH